MEKQFEKYVISVPFWNSVSFEHFQEVSPNAKYRAFVEFKKWFNNRGNKTIIKTIIARNETRIKLNQARYNEKFESLNDQINYRIPSVESLTNYKAMFDES